MAEFHEIKQLYADIRRCDGVLDKIIDDGMARIKQHGRDIIFRDMGISEEIIESFAPSEELAKWQREIYESVSAESDHDELEEAGSDDDCEWTDISTNQETSDEEEVEVEDHLMTIEEEALADKFRNCCDAFGREIRRNLPQTAEYLQHYGRLYLRYATESLDKTTKIDQKLNFLRAAALVNAAIIRFDNLELYENRQNAIAELRCLHHALLDRSVSENKTCDFVAFSNEIKTNIENLRFEEGSRLRYVTILRNRILADGGDKETLQRKVITEIRDIYESNTKNYSSIMAEIILYCLQIMGEAPCDFAIAGLGSLAREEVTLSSDFEHVIILDDKAVIAEEVREYFRWFTVIFHVVVIGLGETVVPSIDIKSLSDQYASDASKKWFKDEHTPCGVSFDGMMPHACKCPLGRQKPTKKYDHIVELIQPASTMANYLTVDQDSENGYLLQDVLQTTVFVYGSQDVYDIFLAKSAEIRQSFSSYGVFLRQREMIHSIEVAWDVTRNIAATYMNVKNTLYRPLTVMLHCISSVLDFSSQSSFNIIDELRASERINEECHHTLSHALAILFEMRTRCYRTKSRQRNIILDRDLPKLVPKEFILDFRVTVIFLFDALKDFYFNLFRLKKDDAKVLLPSRHGDYWQRYVIRESLHFLSNDEVYIKNTLSHIKRLISDHIASTEAAGKAYYLIKACVQNATYTLRRFTKNNAYLSHDYGLLARHELREVYFWSRGVLMRFESNVSENVRSLVEESYVLYHDKDFKTADNLLRQAVQLVERNVIDDYDILDDLAVLEYQLETAFLTPALAKIYFTNRCEKQETYYRKCLLKLGLVDALYRSNNRSEAHTVLDGLVDGVKANSLKMTQFHYSSFMYAAGDVLQKFGSLNDGYQLQEECNKPRDAKFAGEYPDSTDIFADLQMTDHYKYNFGTRWNVGRHSNFTFNSIHYRIPLQLKMLYFRYFSAFHILSSDTYGDMIVLIQLSLDDKQFDKNIPQRHFAMWKQTQAIGIMALCECVKFKDMELFGKLITDSLSTTMKRAKLLQPFIYACLQDYVLHPKADTAVVRKQNGVFQNVFENVTDESYLQASAKFRNFQFKESVAMLWKLLFKTKSRKRSFGNKVLELFLTSVLAVMISRKRKSPIPHLKKCRELSVKQALWFEFAPLDQSHRISMSSWNISLTKLYIRSDDTYALLHNLALDFQTYDERSAAALLWKLIHSRPSNGKLIFSSIYLLFETVDKLCRKTLEFSLHNRQR